MSETHTTTIDVTFAEAACELRRHLHRSQRSMAKMLGLSMGALRNYESGATSNPEARALVAYMLAAENNRRHDLGWIFSFMAQDAINGRDRDGRLLVVGTVTPIENVLINILLACLRGQGPFKKYQEEVMRAMATPYVRTGVEE